MDGFQSTDTRQQLQRRRIESEIISVDKTVLPYYDLREAIYEDRIEFPKFMVRVRPDDTQLTEILVKELYELVDNGTKIDHPKSGSKDVADSVAGVVYSLMGDRTYHKKQYSGFFDQSSTPQEPQRGDRPYHPAMGGMDGLHAPVPPSTGDGLWKPQTRS
jgi:hypothetical protein